MASKNHKYPKAFYDDGLGDILEWIDDEVLIHSEQKESRSSDKKSKKNKKPKSNEQEFVDSDEDHVSSRRKQLKLYGDNDLDKVLNKKPSSKISEDPESGATTVYDANKKLDKSLESRVKGLINRLAAQTMSFVTGEFKKLYSTQSRTDLNLAIFQSVERSILISTSVAKRKLVAELMLLVSILDNQVSHNIGGTIVHNLIRKFNTLYMDGTSDDDKRLDNIAFCLVNLYTTGLISANVIFEITKRICSPEDFRSKSVELLHIILKNIGFQMRKDNPSMMRQLILLTIDQCKALRESNELETRISFILEALDAIKNNNMSKIGNYGCDIDRDTIESTMKSIIKRSKLPETLNDALYEEILHSNSWYLLETRVEELKNSTTTATTNDKNEKTRASKIELKICKALGLNKPVERTIFSALTKVSDFVEASNIVIGYGLNHCSDAMVVILHVAIYEKKYNPFYYNVINNLCKFNRKYKMAAKFAIQDKIRVLGDMPNQRASILARLCLKLFETDAIPITVLKSVEWANLSDSTKQFLTFLLQSISNMSEESKRKIMMKSDKRSSFAGAMRTFANCFLEGCQLFD